MTFRERVAKFERQVLSRPPEAQEALIDAAKTLFAVLGPGGALEMDDLAALFDLLQNAAGKIQRGMLDQVQLMADLSAGAPTLTPRIMKALGV